MNKTEAPVIVEQTFNASIKEVWNALTKLDQMHKWYFDNIPDFDPVVGFETKFNIHNGGRDFFHLWKIIEAVPYKKLSYTWNFEGYPGDGEVVFELSEVKDSTNLKLTLIIIEDYPDDIPEFKRESCINGWNYFLKERLKNYLETT